MFERSSGVLLHISSLPSKYGIGTFGVEAYKFVDFLSASKVKVWQILPLGITSYGDSPYQSPSAFALNYNFIDLDILKEKGLIEGELDLPWGEDENRVDYGALFYSKAKVLKAAFEKFDVNNPGFKAFLEHNPDLYSFAAFMTLKEIHEFRPWYEWEKEYRNFSHEIVLKVRNEHEFLFNYYIWTQFEAVNQYFRLKEYANSKNLKIMGDIPIYLSYDSVEVWEHPELFDLNDKREMNNVAGCPPDCFSVDGQLWGNPLYNWEYHRRTAYDWWHKRIHEALNLYDLLRIDHFRGFSGFYSVPAKDKTARNGVWLDGPGAELFNGLKNLPIVGEDLGQLDEKAYKFFDDVGYPGMRIVNQGLEYEGRDGYWRPSVYNANSFAYSSTHDSNTLRGKIEGDLKLTRKKYNMMKRIINDECLLLNVDRTRFTKNETIDKLIELEFASKSVCSVVLMQDLLHKGDECRMNMPSTLSTSNWSWRINKTEFEKKKTQLARFLRTLNRKYKR